MIAVEKPHFLTVEEYLEGEQLSDIRHEYIGGLVYAMAGTSDEHNFIVTNCLAALHAHLRGKTCRVFVLDAKVRLQANADDIFYYPDLMVACDPRDTDRFFKRYPRVLLEVLSESTERIDRREKFLSYTQIETLEEYILVGQDKMEVTLFRRGNRWQAEVFHAATQSLPLASIDFSIPLASIYEGVNMGKRN
jgi:Uma2 family endonuclease